MRYAVNGNAVWLMLRAMESFAVRHPRRRAALRVLCVLAVDIMENAGRVSQAEIGDRLGISRVAVNKHLKFLEQAGTVAAAFEQGEGAVKTYWPQAPRRSGFRAGSAARHSDDAAGKMRSVG